MKQIFSYLIPYRARMALGFSIKVAATIVELLIPWALSIMVDKVIPTENIGFVFAWGGVMILFAILALLGNIVANRMASLVARNTTERIRLQLFSKISFLSARQQEQIGQASLISRSTSDTYNIHQFIGIMQRLGVRQPIMLIGGLAVTLSMDAPLTCIMLALLPVMAFLVYGSKFRVFLVSVWPELENWTVLITILQNGVAIGGMILFFLAVYNIFPQKRLPYRKQMPGAIAATIGWYSFSAIYATYIRNSKNLAFMYGSLALIIVFLVWMYVCMNIVLIGGEINFLYNNRYYYKLYLLTEKQIDIQEYFMHAKSETEILEPEVVDEEENIKEWEQEESFEEQKEAEILEEPQLAASEEIQEQPDLSEKIE